MTGRPVLRILLLGALLAGCGEPAPSGAENRAERLDALEKEAAAAAETARERTVNEPGERGPEIVLEFEEIVLSPEEASVKTERFEARAMLKPGASPFTEIEYTWTIGDKELIGYTLGRLDRREGKWQALDWVKVQARATDDQGNSVESKFASVQIANGTPEIVTDLSKIKFLNGTKLQAVDPDDDPITWSVKGDPPGVSITDAGVIRVKNVQLEEDFAGEAIFVAEDPHGASQEIHIPLNINAAKAGFTEDAGTKTREAQVRELTDEELLEQAEKDAKLMESLSDEEMKKLLREREEARLKAGQ